MAGRLNAKMNNLILNGIIGSIRQCKRYNIILNIVQYHMVNCKTYERNIIFKVTSSTWINISMRKDSC